MHYLIALLLALLSLVVVSYPLLKARQRQPQPLDDSEPSGRSLDEALNDIERLQMEYELGIVAPEDYRRQLDELRQAAAQSLRASERGASVDDEDSPAPTPEDWDALLEEHIRQRRIHLRDDNGESP